MNPVITDEAASAFGLKTTQTRDRAILRFPHPPGVEHER